jgi:hypothetical protein
MRLAFALGRWRLAFALRLFKGITCRCEECAGKDCSLFWEMCFAALGLEVALLLCRCLTSFSMATQMCSWLSLV